MKRRKKYSKLNKEIEVWGDKALKYGAGGGIAGFCVAGSAGIPIGFAAGATAGTSFYLSDKLKKRKRKR